MTVLPPMRDVFEVNLGVNLVYRKIDYTRLTMAIDRALELNGVNLDKIRSTSILEGQSPLGVIIKIISTNKDLIKFIGEFF